MSGGQVHPRLGRAIFARLVVAGNAGNAHFAGEDSGRPPKGKLPALAAQSGLPAAGAQVRKARRMPPVFR